MYRGAMHKGKRWRERRVCSRMVSVSLHYLVSIRPMVVNYDVPAFRDMFFERVKWNRILS